MVSLIYDALILIGVALVMVGVRVQFGWTYSVMIGGLILISVGIIGGINAIRKAPEPENEKT